MKKKTLFIIGAAALGLILSACALTDILLPGAAGQFNIGIESPQDGETIAMGSVDIVYFASHPAGITQVELSINGDVVDAVASDNGQDISVLRYEWTPASEGTKIIQVRAQNSRGDWSNYVQVNVTVEGLAEPTPEPTATTAAATATEPAPTPDPFTIYDVDPDTYTFYYGDDDCGTRDITITARVNDPDEVYNMVIFTRFADHESFDTTNWDSGEAMDKISDDTWRITFDADELDNYNEYEFATMFYQIVATRENDTELGRTTVFKNVDLEICPQPSMPPQVRFKDITHDVDTFYYGGTACGENDVTITTDVTNPDDAEFVFIFTRFKDKQSNDQTGWDRGATMSRVDEDTFRITLEALELDNYNEYDFAEMSYQFIAQDDDRDETGRSFVHDDISIEVCR